MIDLLMITQDEEKANPFADSWAQYGMTCSTTSHNNGVAETVTNQRPDVVLLEINGQSTEAATFEIIRRVKKQKQLPVIALVPGGKLEIIDNNPDIDDFITSPYNSEELVLRINRLLRSKKNDTNDEVIKQKGLVINLTTCEVTVDGNLVELTFKEYELLKLLAGQPGRVYTREALLDKIWGYDYFGGDRTVDVHIRRLRSKIEDANHRFIETVRNIGYRFGVK